MKALTETIVADWQVRKTRRQKAAFRALLREGLEAEGYAVREEPVSRLGGVNLVVGDVARARVLLTAHYDTCAVLPVPNLIAPLNPVATLLYQLLLMGGMLAVGLICGIGIAVLTGVSYLAGPVSSALVVGMALWMIAGPANRHTANDNTSGVAVLVQTLLTLPEADRSRVAFVFFDLEEAGLFGSAAFHRRHAAHVRGKPLVNFDCVGEGDEVLLVMGKGIRRDEARVAWLRAAAPDVAGKTVTPVSSARALYPSDQMHFPLGVGVAAFRRAPVIGLYLGRIHTRRDTLLDRENIALLRALACRLVAEA